MLKGLLPTCSLHGMLRAGDPLTDEVIPSTNRLLGPGLPDSYVEKSFGMEHTSCCAFSVKCHGIDACPSLPPDPN